MRVLLDTCVLSELRHPNGDARVQLAVEEIADKELFVSVISVGEIVKGIFLLPDGKRKSELHSWVQTLERHYATRIVPVDLETSRIWGELTATAQMKGKTVSTADGLIASTAIRHGLHIMTRNLTDFEPTGAMLINPWVR
ncbi:hypothetical protein MNBD_GAMMA26-1503 [hydrothermal vent metagenome]|uniref:PIN domain-containing protein n=1 Tax=hydrothermal vent metagenome TaxID=652676 RepID=A0A3B1AWC1_9ZZZZ